MAQTCIAVANSGQLASSLDGINWTLRTSSFGTSHINDATNGGGQFIAVGASGKLATSPDGITWTQRTSSFSTSAIHGVCYGSSLYVAVGDSGKLATSSDGITWTQRTSSFSTTTISSVIYGAGIFVAVGQTGKIATSSDGINWTQRTSGTSSDLVRIKFRNGNFIVGVNNGNVLNSSDGINWTIRTTPTSTSIYALEFVGGLYVIAGGSGLLYTSPDLVTWTLRDDGNINNPQYFGMTYANGLLVAAGNNGPTLITSPDGITWTQRTVPITSNITDVIWEPDALADYYDLILNLNLTVASPPYDLTLALLQSVFFGPFDVAMATNLSITPNAYDIVLASSIAVSANTYDVVLQQKVIIQTPPFDLLLNTSQHIINSGLLGVEWDVAVSIDGVSISHDQLTGSVSVEMSEGNSSTAKIAYILDAAEFATFKTTHFFKKPVTIDAVNGSTVLRIFTGRVQTSSWDAIESIVELNCSDTLEDQLTSMALDTAAGFITDANWSDVVFDGKPKSAREYLNHLLEIEPLSLQCDAFDHITTSQLIPSSSLATISIDDITAGTQRISQPDAKQIVNQIEVDLISRGFACYGSAVRAAYYLSQNDGDMSGLSGPKWLQTIINGGKVMDRGMIAQAVNSIGWKVAESIHYIAPTTTAYTLGGTPGVYVIDPLMAPKFAIEFQAMLRKEWGQTLECKDKIVVTWNASINTYGILTEKENYLADSDFNVRDWESSKNGPSATESSGVNMMFGNGLINPLETPDPSASASMTAYGIDPHVGQGVAIVAGKNGLGWGYSQKAINCIVKRCQNEILKSHRATYELELQSLAPGLSIGHGISTGAGTLIENTNPMVISGIKHVWDFGKGEFFTGLSLKYFPVGNAVTENSSTPASFATPVFNSTGYIPDLTVNYYGEFPDGENKIELTISAVPDQYRNTQTLDRSSAPLQHGPWWSQTDLTITAATRS